MADDEQIEHEVPEHEQAADAAPAAEPAPGRLEVVGERPAPPR